MRERYPTKESEYTVVLEHGDVVRLRGIRSVAEASDLRREGMASVERLKGGKCPPVWKPFLDAGEDAFFYLPYLARLVLGVTIDGDEQESEAPSELDWLRIAHEVPMVFDSVRRQIDTVLNVVSAAFQSEYVQKKSETSKATSANGTG